MKCTLRGCPGQYEERRIVQAHRHGDRITVINVRRIEGIVREGGTPSRMAPVYELA